MEHAVWAGPAPMVAMWQKHSFVGYQAKADKMKREY